MHRLTCLATALFASGFVVSRATAGPNMFLSSPVSLTNITVGEIVPIDVNLQGLAVGSDFIFNLNTSVLFDSSLFTPIPDPNNSSGLTPGSDFFFDPSQVANFNAASSLNTGVATGNFSDSSPNTSYAINENGVYYSFDLKAIATGSGSISFNPTPGANEYAADDTGFNYASLPTGGPLVVTINASSVPEPSPLLLLAAASLSGGILFARRNRVRKLSVRNS